MKIHFLVEYGSMQTKNFYQTMKDGTEIYVNRWLPDEGDDVKAVIVLSHGMLEHSLRYDRVGSELAEKGYVFSAHDHRGHGRTAYNAEQKGTGEFKVLAKKDGFNKVESDLEEMIEKAKADFPGKKIVLLGHSFGSFVSQAYIERNSGKIDGCILCGSAGPRNAAVSAGLFISALMLPFHDYNTESEFLQKLAYSGYFKRIPEKKNGFEWISKSEMNQEMYMNDSWCGGTASFEFFRDMFKGLKDIHKPKNMKKISADLPIFLIAGGDDPVGGYGKTLENLVSIYKKNGVKEVELKIYEGYRHEILNEEISDKVIDDMAGFIENKVL